MAISYKKLANALPFSYKTTNTSLAQSPLMRMENLTLTSKDLGSVPIITT